MHNKSKVIILPCPYPVILTVYSYTCFVCANKSALADTVFYQLVIWQCFLCNPCQHIVDTAHAYGQVHHICKQFFHPFIWQILPCMKVSYESLHIGPILHACRHISREFTFRTMPATTHFPVYPVL